MSLGYLPQPDRIDRRVRGWVAAVWSPSPSRSVLAWTATLVLGAFVVALARWGPDWPAQQFRATLARESGLIAWSDQWYAGLALPGYSVLYPPVARVLGAALTGLAAATLAAWAAGRLLPGAGVAAHRRYSVAIAVTVTTNLLIGQVPFLLGTAFGLLAVLTVQQRRHWWTTLFAVACSLSSPLAGAFLLLVGASLVGTLAWRRLVPFCAALCGIGVSAVVGGAEGPFPCPVTSLAGVLGFCAVALVATTRADRLVRRFAVLYVLAAVLAFVVPNPIGGNVTRLGKLVALPLACYLLTGSRRERLLRVACSVLPALAWAVVPASSAAVHGAADPSQNAAYYRGLQSFLHTQNPAGGRLEIPFTREHWEAAYVAPVFPLARGWERQTDLHYNAVLYGPLDASSYRRWLDGVAVSLVALPNVPIDYGGQAEARLLKNPPAYLVPVWHDKNWRVWRVRNAQPLVSGPATVSELREDSFRLQFSGPGIAVVRIHASNLWQVTAGSACVRPSPDGWLQVEAPVPGVVRLGARIGLQVLTGAASCVRS